LLISKGDFVFALEITLAEIVAAVIASLVSCMGLDIKILCIATISGII
jgi:hypothetical protein